VSRPRALPRATRRRRRRRMPPKEPARASEGTTASEKDEDAYPGVPGATKGEVDAFLLALDDYQPVVRAFGGRGGFAREVWVTTTDDAIVDDRYRFRMR